VPDRASSAPTPERPTLDHETLALLARATALAKYPLARLISLVEREDDDGRSRRAALFRYLRDHEAQYRPRGRVIGVTGTPGAGKSSLIGRVVLECLAADARLRVAVLAIDPTSPSSGGALLGDRLRTHFPVAEPRVFFRSQATQGDLGGMGRRTFAVTRLLRCLFDLVFVETVGIGQSEIEVTRVADLVVLVMQPLAGDHVQFLKAGIMEVPDVFVINKCDEDALARRSAHELRAALAYANIQHPGGHSLRIFQTSAVSGRGIPELAAFLRSDAVRPFGRLGRHAQELYFLRKAIAERWGRFGVEEAERALNAVPPAIRDAATYEELEDLVVTAVARRIR